MKVTLNIGFIRLSHLKNLGMWGIPYLQLFILNLNEQFSIGLTKIRPKMACDFVFVSNDTIKHVLI